MKKVFKVIFVICFTFISIVPMGTPVSAKTLKQYKNEVAALEAKAKENKRVTANAKASINSKRNAIITANNTIEENEKKVENAKIKVAESEEQIKIKTAELQDVLAILQYTNNNSNEVYLEYILKANSVTELMERQAIVEQIANYTQEELEGLEVLIDKNQKLQVELNEENGVLTDSTSTYEKQVRDLEKYIDSLASIGLDYEEDIKGLKNSIAMYEKAGCKDGDDIDACYYSKQGGSSYFSRPLNSGRVTQAWGNNGHKGIDLGGNKKGTPIYAPANGTVVTTAYYQSCGGNQIYIHHTVGGKAYTSGFAHLTAINVKPGQTVYKGQQIGTVGGDSSTFYYDSCTTGAHLHYSISYGYYKGSGANGYSSWNTFTANSKATGVQSISNFNNKRGWTWSNRG